MSCLTERTTMCAVCARLAQVLMCIVLLLSNQSINQCYICSNEIHGGFC
jgi:hypothetical protein